MIKKQQDLECKCNQCGRSFTIQFITYKQNPKKAGGICQSCAGLNHKLKQRRI